MRTIKMLILLFTGILLTSCIPQGGVRILSMETGKAVTIEREFADGYRMCILSVSKEGNTPVVHLATQDKNGRNFIIKYDMDGNKLGKYELPFRNNELLLKTNINQCVFIPEQSKLLYTVNYINVDKGKAIRLKGDDIYSYVPQGKKSKKLISFEPYDAVTRIIPITQKIMMVETNLYYYTIDTETGNIISKIFFDHNNRCMCVDSENKRMLILEKMPNGFSSAMNVYDIFTGKLRNHVMDNLEGSYCKDAIFYKDKIVYRGKGRIFMVDMDEKKPPVLLYSGKEDCYLSELGFLTDNKMCFVYSDQSSFDFIVFDLEEKKEVKRFNTFIPTYGVRYFDEYIIYEM